MTKTISLPIDDIVFVKELYPRLREDDAAVERYRAAIDQLPPIIVARGHVLVDGFHRWQAHQREGKTDIRAENLGDIADTEILEQSYRRNAKHGQQLSKSDKVNAANHLYFTLGGTPEERYEFIADVLSLEVSVAKKYSAEARTDEQRRKKETAWDMWLDCHTQQTIADAVDESRQTISNWTQKREQDSRFCRPPGGSTADPESPGYWGNVQHFDVWQFATADDDAGTASYYGKMPPQFVENMIWLYTEPGQIVFDPFVGGGTTIDVAKRMGRRIWASDRKPSTPTLPIHRHNIIDGWPAGAPRQVDFILLDPPYWKQAAGRYSDDPDDLANMTLEDFDGAWARIVKTCAAHLKPGGKLAYIISPSKDGDAVVDHAYRMHGPCEDAELVPTRRIIATYNSQQWTGSDVTWARDNKRLLMLYRDIVVFTR